MLDPVGDHDSGWAYKRQQDWEGSHGSEQGDWTESVEVAVSLYAGVGGTVDEQD